jgi:hypothetical protein
MKHLLLFLSICASCFADTAAIDSGGYVVAYSASSTPATPPATGTFTIITPSVGIPGAAQGFSILDEFGRCAYTAADGAPVVRVALHWPADAPRRIYLKRLVADRIDDLNEKISKLTAWQADPRLVAIWDRSGQLTQAQNALTAIINVLNGP